MSDAAASDDSDLRSIAHIGRSSRRRAIAMAKCTGARGGDVLAAMVLGYEIAGRKRSRPASAVVHGFESVEAVSELTRLLR